MLEYLVLGRVATKEEQIAIEKAQEILKEAGLDLIGTRPTTR